LVSYEDPPVVEVGLSFQFAPNTVDLDVLALFAERVRGDLPVRELQPVAPPIVETFDALSATPLIQFQLDFPATLPRAWFLDADGVQLVQLQHDRLSLNWRELDTGRVYPRYDQLRARFEELLTTLHECTSVLERTLPPINMCEVIYVNPIEAHSGAGALGHADLAKILNRLRGRPTGAFLPDAEDAQLQTRWRIPAEELPGADAEGGPVGRLYLSATPGLKPPTNVPIYVLNLVARVIPAGDEVGAAWRALDVAHRWTVLGFTDLTTKTMHDAWGRRERTP